MPRSYPNILLIAGSGRNSGKTTLGEALIKQNSSRGVIALKISNHFHGHYGTLKLLHKIEGLIIGEELESKAQRDSNRYLKAGALRSIYAECSDQMLPDLLQWLTKNLDNTEPIICESGGLGNYISPGQAIFLKGGNKKCHWSFPYLDIIFEQIEEISSQLKWTENGWESDLVPLH